MRVLMFGWEFPPNISGGLGSACYGLASGLLQNEVEVLFVVPKLFGDEDKNKFRFISATDTTLNFKDPFYFALQKRLDYIQVNSAIIPYLSPEEYTKHATVDSYDFHSGANIFSSNFEFSGLYGKNLMNEVSQYAIVASKIASENHFNVIHAHDWLTFPAGIIAKQMSKKPLVIHIHATEFDRSGENINQAVFDIEQKGMEEADSVVAVSNYTKNILINKYGIPAGKIKVVHNGVLQVEDISRRYIPPVPKKNKIVTFLGRVTFQKGPDYFIEAAKKVLERFPETHFVMAGSGDMLTRMIRRVAELRMSSNFHFTGFLDIDDTERMYSMSDVYVMPSVSEPFGISPLEAARSGVPVIISKQSGVSEVLINALKVDFWDIDALSDSICALLNYNTLSEILRKKGKKEIENLTWERSSLKVKQIYQTLI